MKAPSAPTPTDPNVAASAQTSTNVATAVANQRGSLVNQTTPYGDLTYNQAGTFTYNDPLNGGNTYEIPYYEATTTLSPLGQEIQDYSDEASVNLAGLASDQTGKLRTMLNEPLDLRDKADNHLFDLGRKRLDPLFAERRADLDTQLSNQGIKLGSSAYDRAIRGFNEGRNDAYNQLALAGDNQAFNIALTEHNQKINEPMALLSGSQVQQPVFATQPGFNMPTTDVAGLYAANDANRMAAYNQRVASRGSNIGGLFSLAGSLGGGALAGGVFG